MKTPVLWLDYYHSYWTSEDEAGLARTMALDGTVIRGRDAGSFGDTWRYEVTKRKGFYVVTHVLASFRWDSKTCKPRVKD